MVRLRQHHFYIKEYIFVLCTLIDRWVYKMVGTVKKKLNFRNNHYINADLLLVVFSLILPALKNNYSSWLF